MALNDMKHCPSRLLLIDKIVIGYAAIIVAVALTRLDLTAANWGIALGHALVPLLIWTIRRPGTAPSATCSAISISSSSSSASTPRSTSCRARPSFRCTTRS